MGSLSRSAPLFGAVLLGLVLPTAEACEAAAMEPCPVLSLEAGYVGDAWRNTHGGLQTGHAFLNKLDLLATVDGGRAFGIDGLTLHGHVQYTNGHEFSGRFLGDAQGASNIEGVKTWRIYELWSEFNFGASGDTSVKLGLYDLNSEFDSIEPATLFLNSSQGIGADYAQSGLNGPSIFPVTSLALRVGGKAGKFNWRLAALDAVPGRRDDPTRTGFRIGSEEGALLAAEVGYESEIAGALTLGAWRYTAAFDTLNEFDTDGAVLRARGNQGVYASAVRSVYAKDALQVTGWLRGGVATARFNPFANYVGAGLTAHGWWAARPNDQLGLALARVQTGTQWREATALAGGTPGTQETTLELTWRAPVTDWLTLQPDLQYVFHPGADSSSTNGFAVGLRFELSGSWSR